MKKILSLVLAALMVFSMVPAIFADDAVTAVAEEASEYQAAIDFLKLLSIYKGDGTGDAAAEAVTRWQMALFVSRFITGQVDATYWATEENDSGFTDVEDFEGASEEALGAISFASQKGIVNGVGEGLFDPETGVQYREAITMIVRALGYTYKASGYPWSYINKAREIGLLDGITGISYTEQINREVVAQLLYNALFVEMDGTNVAESVFNVGATVVLITATNAVAYNDEDKVLRTNYVRFQELDAQGEPTGAQYHVSADKFGLDTKTYADDAAVGTAYFVYYVNGCADIIYAESLTSVYENRGADAAVAYSTSGGKNYLTIAGSKYQIVSLYNELNKAQSWNQDAAGTSQVKVYQTSGKLAVNANSQFIVDSIGNVWVADTTAASGYALYAQYSAVMDCYYRLNGDKWELLDLEEILLSAGAATAAFKQITSVNSKLAYADFVVTDASMDGNADRVTVKQYSFGQITYGNRKNKDNKDQEWFQIYTVDESSFATTSVNNFKKADGKTDNTALGSNYNSGKSTGAPFTTDFRWTGMARADVAKNAYVLYYVDEANKEVNILKVVDADAADGTYTVKGYLRGYDAANDIVYLDADFASYAIGYDNLAGAPLKDKTTTSTANNNLQNNINIIQPLVNTYVTLVIVDNKVVKIDAAGSSADYVIIDSFVAFEEDGIVANAWTTVSDEYTQIKINELNGWTVGGFDYYLYFLSGLFQNGKYADVIPVKAKTLYQVVYTKDGVYNLTLPTSSTAQKLVVNAYGYIEGAKGDGTLGNQYYTATNAADYWLILNQNGTANDTSDDTVIPFNGILNPVVTVDGNVYKSKDKDYVIVVSDATKITGMNNLSGKVTQFMMYNTKVSGVNNNYLFIQTSAYSWSVLMQDVYTGVTSMVAIDSKLVPAGWDGKNYAQIGLVDGTIYAVVDGKLTQTTGNEKTFTDVAKFYAPNADSVGTIVMEGNKWTVKETSFSAGKTTGISTTSLRDQLAEKLIARDYKNWVLTDHNTLNDNLDTATIYMQNSNKFLTNNLDTINGLIKDANAIYTVDYVITAEGKVTAWVNAAQTVVTTGTVTPAKAAVVVAGAETVVEEAYMPTIAWSFNDYTDKLTITYTAGTNKVAYTEASSVRVSIDGVLAPVEATVTADAGLASFTLTVDATAAPADVDVTVVVDATTEVIFW